MTAESTYRVSFDGRPATRAELDRLDDVVVKQERDVAWEARIRMPMCLDESGSWTGDDAEFMTDFSRVRVQVRPGDGDFVTLIEGPVVGFDTERSTEPGTSSMTLIVHDDSVYLNRQADTELQQGRTDREIVEGVFREYPEHISGSEVSTELPPPPESSRPPEVFRRGTHMGLLRYLARRHGMHAYVLPGDDGRSRGYFVADPTERDASLPDLVLAGPDRNLESFDQRYDAQQATDVQSTTLSISDKAIANHRSNWRDEDLVSEAPLLPGQSVRANRMARPGAAGATSSDQADAHARRDRFAFSASGTVKAGCYAAALSPYRRVRVRLGGTRASGEYVIHKVTHTLGRNAYRQEFEVKTDGETPVGGMARSLAQGLF